MGMIKFTHFTSIFALVLSVTMAYSADWPQFFGPNRNGMSPETGLNKDWAGKPPKTLWKMDMHDDGFAGPAIKAGILYIIDRDGDKDVVKAMDLSSGAVKWTHTYDDPGRANYGYARCSPTVSGDRVYTLSRTGMLFCLDIATGKPVWQKQVVETYGGSLPRWQHSLSPFIEGNTLYVCPGGSENPIALDKATGAEKFKGNVAEAVSYATPVLGTVGGKTQMLLFMAKNLYGVDPGSGKSLWSIEWPTSYDVHAALPLPMGDDRVFIASGYGTGCAMVKVTGDKAEFLWKNKNAVSHFSSPILYKNHIWANSDKDYLVCIDPANGNAKWKAEGFEKGAFLIADDVILALGGKTGDLVMVATKADQYTELGRLSAPLGGMSWTQPILSDRRLVIRNKVSLAVLDLR